MSTLNNILKEAQHDFGPYFHSRVLSSLRAERKMWWSTLSWNALKPALSLAAFCLLWLLWQDGGLSISSLVGIGGIDEQLTEYLMYY